MTRALLVVLTQPVEGREDEYNAWYTDQHLDDVLGAAGFSAAQRFRFVPSALSKDPPRPYLAIYEVDAADRERAEQLMIDAVKSGAISMSDALLRPSLTWWFESISDRKESISVKEGQP